MLHPMTQPAYLRASRCSSGGCVEVAIAGAGDQATIDVRDGKQSGGAVLTFTALEWRVFVAGVRAGEFDVPT